MRTLHLRIIVTFTAALLVSVIGVSWVSARIQRHTIGEFFEGSMKLELQQAQYAYENGGPEALKAYLNQVDGTLKGTRFLTDADGVDLVSGLNRSAMRNIRLNFLGLPKFNNGGVTIARPSPDGKYWLIVTAPPPLRLASFSPYFILILIVTLALAWGLSAGIVSPLLKVAGTMEQFGRGELSTRIYANRRDEIGTVARAFNDMASRIETLLTIERRLLQDVSHELRSPLARLSFATELLKTAPDKDAAIARVRREVERLSQLVSTLTEMSSVETDAATHRGEQVSITQLVKDIVQDCRIEAEARGVLIDVTAKSSPVIEGDAELLRRAIENVLRNAVRYSPSHSTIAVGVNCADGNVEISIRDQGPGVPEDQLARIFDPFFRVDDSRNTANGGVGLGLSIARRATLFHHGQICAKNLSPGLQVTVRMPLATS
jgi:signal transduction histidine kinase